MPRESDNAILDTEACSVIRRLGGPSRVGELCEISSQAVTQWKKNGIPKAQRKFLLAVKPEVFETETEQQAIDRREAERRRGDRRSSGESEAA